MALATTREDMQERRNGAFTLIELLVVIAIMGVLMGLITGMAVFAKRKASEARARTELNYIADLVEKWWHGDLANYGVSLSVTGEEWHVGAVDVTDMRLILIVTTPPPGDD